MKTHATTTSAAPIEVAKRNAADTHWQDYWLSLADKAFGFALGPTLGTKELQVPDLIHLWDRN